MRSFCSLTQWRSGSSFTIQESRYFVIFIYFFIDENFFIDSQKEQEQGRGLEVSLLREENRSRVTNKHIKR